MNRIDLAFKRAREEGRAALVMFITAGDPDLVTTEKLVPALFEAGADIVELGVPHSDPIAEGPTIQASSARSLARQTSLSSIFELTERVRHRCDGALVLMGYLNNMIAYGEDCLIERCQSAGIDGLIVADVSYEATDSNPKNPSAVSRILLVTPTSAPERVLKISTRSRGFVYCVSTTGVTGERAVVSTEVASLVRRIQRLTDTPVAVGFGISNAEQAKLIVQAGADGIIIGSALVRKLEGASSSDQAVETATQFVREIVPALSK